MDSSQRENLEPLDYLNPCIPEVLCYFLHTPGMRVMKTKLWNLLKLEKPEDKCQEAQ